MKPPTLVMVHGLVGGGRGHKAGRLAAIGLAVILLGYAVAGSAGVVQNPLPQMGYTARKVTWQATVQDLVRYEQVGQVVSNNPEMVYILTSVPAYVRPIGFDQYQQRSRQDYQAQLAQTTAIMNQGAIFVVFDQVEPDDKNLIDAAGLVLVGQTEHARFYGLPGLSLPKDSGGSG